MEYCQQVFDITALGDFEYNFRTPATQAIVLGHYGMGFINWLPQVTCYGVSLKSRISDPDISHSSTRSRSLIEY
jgi:hypothetical protein